MMMTKEFALRTLALPVARRVFIYREDYFFAVKRDDGIISSYEKISLFMRLLQERDEL